MSSCRKGPTEIDKGRKLGQPTGRWLRILKRLLVLSREASSMREKSRACLASADGFENVRSNNGVAREVASQEKG